MATIEQAGSSELIENGSTREGKARRALRGRSQEKDQLVDQFYITLNAYFLRIEQRNGEAGNNSASAVLIRRLLHDENRTWRDAYQIEQLIIPLYSDEELDVEINRRLLEAKKHLHIDVYTYYQKAFQEQEARANREALLGRLVNDLQWRYEIGQLEKEYSRVTRSRTGIMFIVAVLGFMAAVVGIVTLPLPDIDGTNLGFIGIALLAGWVGASFSMLISLKGRLEESSFDDLKVLHKWGFINTRAVVGVGAALVIFYFMAAEMITGPLLPKLGADLQDSKDLALLVIWCFLAGFSEKLVPSLLSKTEDQVRDRPPAPTSAPVSEAPG